MLKTPQKKKKTYFLILFLDFCCINIAGIFCLCSLDTGIDVHHCHVGPKKNVRSTQSTNFNGQTKQNFEPKSGGGKQAVSAEPTRLLLVSHLKIRHAFTK